MLGPSISHPVLRIRGGRWGNTERPSGVEGEGDRRGASRRASASFGEPMGPVWGGAKTHRTLSALRCGATALCSKTHGSAVEEVGGVPPPTVVGSLSVRRPSIRRDGMFRRS